MSLWVYTIDLCITVHDGGCIIKLNNIINRKNIIIHTILTSPYFSLLPIRLALVIEVWEQCWVSYFTHY